MPGFELFSEEEKNHVKDVLESGILMRYNFDNLRNNHWKARELESALQKKIKGSLRPPYQQRHHCFKHCDGGFGNRSRR